MQDDDFDWFENEMEIETEEFTELSKTHNTSTVVIDSFFNLANHVLAIAIFLRLVRYVFGFNTLEILGVNLNTILMDLMIFLGSLALVVMSVRVVVFLVQQLSPNAAQHPMFKISRFVSITIWLVLNLYWMEYNSESLIEYHITKKVLYAGIVTFGSYTAVAFAMSYFESSFVESSLKSKTSEIYMSERILAAMKNFRYEISETDSITTATCSCRDVFCFGTHQNEGEDNNNRLNLSRSCRTAGNVVINPPELHTVVDAKTLARDVFYKAGNNGPILTFDDFSAIFPNTQIALNAFSYFDANNDRKIDKKEFHNTIITFYMNRVNFEKNIERTEEFIGLISSSINISLFGFLCLFYLVLFGIPLKELLALALSSALVLNFVASGVAADLYYNFMMLLTHQFDIGDDIMVDGVDYRVYEFGLTSTSLICNNGGKVKLLNSDLWKKCVINMTRAPEKIIVFNFKLKPDITQKELMYFKARISELLKIRKFDFYDTFNLQASSDSFTDINVLSCSLVLRCKSYKNKSKKFTLRAEMTGQIRHLIDELEIYAK